MLTTVTTIGKIGTAISARRLNTGHLIYGASRQELISEAYVNKSAFSFQLDCGCSVRYDYIFYFSVGIMLLLMLTMNYSQIDSKTASTLGLKSHRNLVGVSRMGDGSCKYDYISVVTMGLLEEKRILVVKVAPDQPFLFGLDAMHLFKMNIDFFHQSFTIGSPSANDISGMKVFDFMKLLEKAKVGMDDLVPLSSLPPPEISFKALLDTGKTNMVVDLGFSTTCTVKIPRYKPLFF